VLTVTGRNLTVPGGHDICHRRIGMRVTCRRLPALLAWGHDAIGLAAWAVGLAAVALLRWRREASATAWDRHVAGGGAPAADRGGGM